GRGHGLLHDVVFLAEVAYRLEESVDVLDERHDATDGQDAAQHLRAAVPDDGGSRDSSGNADYWPEQRKEQDAAQMRLQQVAIQRVEVAIGGQFAIEQLDDVDATDVLRNRRVDPRQPNAHCSERLAHPFANDVRQHQ